jgi:thiol peroxidase
MDQTNFKGTPVKLKGAIPGPGGKAPNFSYVREDLSEGTLASFKGKKKVLIAVPSLDTGICQMETRRFNKELSARKDTVGLVISKDLPFAMKRFCAAEGIENVEIASDFRGNFTDDYNTRMEDGPLKGLSARVVLVLDANDQIAYKEVVDDITHEPDYERIMSEVDKL